MQTGSIEIRLRAEQPEDSEFLYLLYASTRANEMALAPWSEEQKEAFLRSQFHLQRTHYRHYYPEASFDVIVHDTQPIGRLYVHRSSAEIRLMDIAIIPQYRSGGLGTRLLTRLLDEAVSTGKLLTLHVERNNPAIRWYEKLGLRSVADAGPYVQMERRARSEPTGAKPHPADRGDANGC
ncbi:MAG: GNAT family N-acetyltransferase [Acidobacteriaceae bacterium]|nr:GNAT family N-acetyltransferase [Acidobacteriaceae bacterium]